MSEPIHNLNNPDGITRHVHMCCDISGVLKRSGKFLHNMFSDNGKRKPGKVVRAWLESQLAEGKRVLPMGKCEGFDYQTGCPGHEIK